MILRRLGASLVTVAAAALMVVAMPVSSALADGPGWRWLDPDPANVTCYAKGTPDQYCQRSVLFDDGRMVGVSPGFDPGTMPPATNAFGWDGSLAFAPAPVRTGGSPGITTCAGGGLACAAISTLSLGRMLWPVAQGLLQTAISVPTEFIGPTPTPTGTPKLIVQTANTYGTTGYYGCANVEVSQTGSGDPSSGFSYHLFTQGTGGYVSGYCSPPTMKVFARCKKSDGSTADLLINVAFSGAVPRDETRSTQPCWSRDWTDFALAADKPYLTGEWQWVRAVATVNPQAPDAFNKGFDLGSPDLPSPADSVRNTTKCQRPDGTFYDVPAALSAVGLGIMALATCVAGGQTAGGLTVDKPIGVTTEVVHSDGTVTPQSTATVPATRSDPAGPYPACSTTDCPMQVELDGKLCSVGFGDCPTWTTAREAAPARVRCLYGPYVVSGDLCNLLERFYQTGDRPLTRDNTDGRPGTQTPPQYVPQPQPSPTPTPTPTATTTLSPSPSPTPTPTSTGTAVPVPTGTATPTATATSTATVAPTGTAPPSASPTAGAEPVPVADPLTPGSEQSECWPSGFGAFNPANWVLQPTKCALKWAFVPTPAATATQATRVRSALDAKGISPLLGAVGGVVGQLGGNAGGCEGPLARLDLGPVHLNIHPVDACTEPMATVAGIAKAVASVGLVVFGGLAFIRAVAAGFGFNFSMGGKGSGDES